MLYISEYKTREDYDRLIDYLKGLSPSEESISAAIRSIIDDLERTKKTLPSPEELALKPEVIAEANIYSVRKGYGPVTDVYDTGRGFWATNADLSHTVSIGANLFEALTWLRGENAKAASHE